MEEVKCSTILRICIKKSYVYRSTEYDFDYVIFTLDSSSLLNIIFILCRPNNLIIKTKRTKGDVFWNLAVLLYLISNYS